VDVCWVLSGKDELAIGNAAGEGQLSPPERGSPLFDAFARQKWSEAVREIQPVLATHERVGGRRARRDLLEYTVTTALLRNGQADQARQLISKRRPANGRGGFPIAGLVD
jgi:hypothetical protein